VTITRNTFLAGPSTDPKAAAFMLGGEGDLRLDMVNNEMRGVNGGTLAAYGIFGSGKAKAGEYRPVVVEPIPPIETTLANCGSRPWDRDPIDARIVADVRNGTGKIIDSEQEVGGYPVRPETRAPFVEAEWNLETMTRR
jgi:hypothetical protein